ncbi:MAG: hypothetical protein NTW51_14525 [Cyanobacteria bacterium]|jgi:hypothetical protein|nr:hypothetical protein [Cyanobacteriota bacterium]
MEKILSCATNFVSSISCLAGALFTLATPVHAGQPVGDLQIGNIYTRFSRCIVNEYGEGADSPRDQAKCRGILIESNSKAQGTSQDTKNGFTYYFYATLRSQDFLISYVTDSKNLVKYVIVGGDNFIFGGPASGDCIEYLRNSSNHIIVCAAHIIEDQLGKGSSKNLSYTAAINLAKMTADSTGVGLSTSLSKSLQARCTGAAIGSLLGLVITGNTRKSTDAIPTECRQQQNSPSPQYQQPSIPNKNLQIKLPNTYLNPNRAWLQDSMRDTDRFRAGSGWRSIERNPSGF